jgi:signal transduction histidine kinase
MPEPAQAMLARLLRASQRLDALTRDLLEFSRVVRQDVKLAPVDVAEIVNEIIITTPALQDGVVEMPESLGIVRAQRTLLQQCLTNLFDNALKFARPDIPPKIIVRAEGRGGEGQRETSVATAAFIPSVPPLTPATEATAGGSSLPWPAQSGTAPRIRIWVEDNGIGVPVHAHQKIFGIFERVSGLENVEGTGIGLAIVARAVQQMGGACGVESELGAGSRFWIELAAAQ